jgi:tRNA-splicing ligase RtcB
MVERATDNFEVFQGKRVPVKAWVKGVQLEEEAKKQLLNLASLPIVYKWIVAMPDVHWGKGSTVGSVIATKGAIMPATVGVDIGCGMIAAKTDLVIGDLPRELGELRAEIEKAVPHGRTEHGGEGDKGAWAYRQEPLIVSHEWMRLEVGWTNIIAKYPKLSRNADPIQHLGTLGTGNHFIEICRDEGGCIWIMLHSGSRGPGNRIGSLFTRLAKAENDRWFVDLPDPELAFLPKGTELFDDYTNAVVWAQDFARVNRELMLGATLHALENVAKRELGYPEGIINCHHNYVALENHYGANVYITRKGAVRARKGDMGIIPGSMGVCSYIVRGLGNPESFHSCSHGAGRAMSRTAARKKFSLEDHAKATEGVECRKDEAVIDETPAAYKDIEAVMRAQEDLVEVVHTLKQVVCVKG